MNVNFVMAALEFTFSFEKYGSKEKLTVSDVEATSTEHIHSERREEINTITLLLTLYVSLFSMEIKI